MQTPSKDPPVLLAATHHGQWKGPSRLWITDPENALRSDGEAEVAACALDYTWAYEGQKQTGRIELSGQPLAIEAKWTDTWHAAGGMILHGELRDSRLTLRGTYGAGEYGVWGWIIELDCQDRERFFMRMHNVIPGIGPMPAVILEGMR